MPQFLVMLALAVALVLPSGGVARADGLAGSWSGGGSVHYGDTREKARCKARFVLVSGTLHEMRASCATPSGRVDQIATLNRVGDNHYAGSFQNTQYSVTGSIQATVRGNSLSVRLKGDGGGSGSFNLSRN